MLSEQRQTNWLWFSPLFFLSFVRSFGHFVHSFCSFIVFVCASLSFPLVFLVPQLCYPTKPKQNSSRRCAADIETAIETRRAFRGGKGGQGGLQYPVPVRTHPWKDRKDTKTKKITFEYFFYDVRCHNYLVAPVFRALGVLILSKNVRPIRIDFGQVKNLNDFT